VVAQRVEQHPDVRARLELRPAPRPPRVERDAPALEADDRRVERPDERLHVLRLRRPVRALFERHVVRQHHQVVAFGGRAGEEAVDDLRAGREEGEQEQVQAEHPPPPPRREHERRRDEQEAEVGHPDGDQLHPPQHVQRQVRRRVPRHEEAEEAGVERAEAGPPEAPGRRHHFLLAS
jgi:hypothetical protein